MADFPLSEKLRAVRASLSDYELRLLSQEVLNKITPMIYAEGVADGQAKLLEKQRDERERRKVGRGRKEWITSVYFVRSPSAVKIGRSKNPLQRLGVLQTSHPEPLELAALADGGEALEREYHRRFAEHRLHGEWFSPAAPILAEIDRLKEQAA